MRRRRILLLLLRLRLRLMMLMLLYRLLVVIPRPRKVGSSVASGSGSGNTGGGGKGLGVVLPVLVVGRIRDGGVSGRTIMIRGGIGTLLPGWGCGRLILCVLVVMLPLLMMVLLLMRREMFALIGMLVLLGVLVILAVTMKESLKFAFMLLVRLGRRGLLVLLVAMVVGGRMGGVRGGRGGRSFVPMVIPLLLLRDGLSSLLGDNLMSGVLLLLLLSEVLLLRSGLVGPVIPAANVSDAVAVSRRLLHAVMGWVVSPRIMRRFVLVRMLGFLVLV
jgi:hypothetical protein